ncbi:MAG: hypothetical protein QM499_12210 [Flavobacteriaceae bacterium]
MKNILEESKCLASLAVFRELYNSEKDIYGVIGEFLKEIITSNGKHQFSLTEITQLLNNTYDFNIPKAVINTSLNRFKSSLEKTEGLFTITNQSTFAVTGKLTGIHTSTGQNNERIITNLFKYIEEEKKSIITDEEKEKIVHSFCSFIIDESSSQEYSEFVSAFILKGKQDSDFTKRLNTIKEGVVLYTGLKYNSNINNLGSWNSELTIYIETEILFHFAGYNGQLYELLFNDFFTLVKEVNQKSQKKTGKKLIHLKYFPEIKDEIERFFKKAEYIVSGKDKANPSKTAMSSIIDGCKSLAEIIEKKTRFFELLTSNSILEDDYLGYYSERNHKYNIEDQKLLKKISDEMGIENISNYVKYLNYINIHRKGISDKGFEKVQYVLLSGTKNTLAIAWNETIKPNGNVPLASNLGFLTNKFWFRLNKGFGKDVYPKTFDIVTKAQIVLSTQLNDSVADKFEELQVKFKTGSLTEEQSVASIVELRRQAKRPEEINEYDVDDVLKSIEESSLEKYLQEQELFKNKAEKQEEENLKLKAALEQKQKEIEEKEIEYQKTLKQKESDNLEKEKILSKYRDEEKIKTENREKIKRLRKKIIIYFILILIIISGVLLYIYYNRLLGIVTGTIAGLFTIAAFFRIDYEVIKKLWK